MSRPVAKPIRTKRRCMNLQPKLPQLAYNAGVPIADARSVGVQLRVRNGWYPVASTDSWLGGIFLRSANRPLVAYHHPSLIWPWQTEVFGVIPFKMGKDVPTDG